MDIKQTIKEIEEQFRIFERPSAINSRILLAIVNDLTELLNDYKNNINKLELEIKMSPFDKIKHKIIILATYKEIIKDLDYILQSPFVNPKPTKETNSN